MPKFVYKFETILDLKEQIEDNLKNELGKAYRKLEFEKDKLMSLENEKKELVTELVSKTSDGIPAGKIREYGSYLGVVRERIWHQQESVNYAQCNVDKCKERLIKAVQEKKMFEKLKEKQYRVYMKEQFRQEQRLTDEIVSYNEARKTSPVSTGGNQ